LDGEFAEGNSVCTNAVDLREIYSADSKGFGANVELDMIPPSPLSLTSRFQVMAGPRLGLQAADVLRNLLIALDDLLLIMIKGKACLSVNRCSGR
jgi:hypothetical protein